jgi:hypothetical protein
MLYYDGMNILQRYGAYIFMFIQNTSAASVKVKNNLNRSLSNLQVDITTLESSDLILYMLMISTELYKI